MFKNFFNRENFFILFIRGFNKSVHDFQINGNHLADPRWHFPQKSSYYKKGYSFGNWYNVYRYEAIALYITFIGILVLIIW